MFDVNAFGLHGKVIPEVIVFHVFFVFPVLVLSAVMGENKPGKLASKQASKARTQASNQACWEAGRQGSRQAGRQAGRQGGRQAGRQAGRQFASNAE